MNLTGLEMIARHWILKKVSKKVISSEYIVNVIEILRSIEFGSQRI